MLSRISDLLVQFERFLPVCLLIVFYIGAWSEFRVREYMRGAIASFFALFLCLMASGICFKNQPLALAIMLLVGIGAPLVYYCQKRLQKNEDK